jgi:hypothetical protein
MKRITMKGVGLAAVAAIGLMIFGTTGCSHSTEQGGLRTQMIDSGDKLQSKDVAATVAPASGQQSVTVAETLHYVNEPVFKHNTAYTINRTVVAPYVVRVGYFVVNDKEGDWYSINAGSQVASKLPGKPQATIGAQAGVLDINDQSALGPVTAGDVVSGNPRLKATYNYTHVEPLDDVRYTVTSAVETTFVADQNAWYAWVSGSLFRLDNAGQVSQLNDKPSVDRGSLGNLISHSDSTGTNADVTFSGGFFLATWHHVHEETFEHIRYTTKQEVRADFVPEVNSYMAWIDGTEYQAVPGSSVVDRLNDRPVVQLGQRSTNIGYDKAVRADVFNVSSTNVVIRYYFHRNEAYVAKEYYVERTGVMYYNKNWSVWMVAIDGHSYVVGWDGDSSPDSSVPVLHAPAGSARPQYVVPSTSGDGLPPAVVPGRDPSNGGNTVPPPAPAAGGIPGRSPSSIPGRAPAPALCIPGRCQN